MPFRYRLVELSHLRRQAGASIAGCGIAITKAYQKGERRIADQGIEVQSLARIIDMHDGQIIFG